MALYYIDVCIIFNLQKIGSIDQKVSELWPLAFDYLDILENLAFAQIGQLVKISKWARRPKKNLMVKLTLYANMATFWPTSHALSIHGPPQSKILEPPMQLFHPFILLTYLHLYEMRSFLF